MTCRFRTLLLVSALLVGLVSTTAADQARELQVKGAFVFNVLNFVEWPTAGVPTEPLRIAVVSTEPMADFSAAFTGRTIKGRSVTVRVYQSADQLTRCDVLFVAADATPQLRALLKQVEAQPVLTIAEQDLDAPAATMIALGVTQARMAFQVNLDAADAVGLQLSANLLKLARHVRSQRDKPLGR